MSTSKTYSFHLVKIPAQLSLPLEQLSLTIPTADVGSHSGAILSFVEPYFRLQEGESVDIELIQEQVAPAYAKGCAGGMCPHISLTSLRKHAEEGNPEFVKMEDYRVYYDDAARLKRRDINERATKWYKKNNNGTRQSNNHDDGDAEQLDAIYGDVFVLRFGTQNDEILSISPLELIWDMEI